MSGEAAGRGEAPQDHGRRLLAEGYNLHAAMVSGRRLFEIAQHAVETPRPCAGLFFPLPDL